MIYCAEIGASLTAIVGNATLKYKMSFVVSTLVISVNRGCRVLWPPLLQNASANSKPYSSYKILILSLTFGDL